MTDGINHVVAFRKRLTLLMAMFFIWGTSSYALDVTLQWDANTEADLAGYKIYYKAETSGPSYDGTGAMEGNSPIDVGPATTLELSGLIGKDYYFVVTAHDYLGRESAYSNEVTVLGSEEEIFLPLVLKLS